MRTTMQRVTLVSAALAGALLFGVHPVQVEALAQKLPAFTAQHYGAMIQTWHILQWLSEEEGAFALNKGARQDTKKKRHNSNSNSLQVQQQRQKVWLAMSRMRPLSLN